MSGNRSGFWGGLVIGAALGAIGGMLAAPRTGRETRRILKKSANALPEIAEDLSTTVQFQADRLSESALRNWDGTLGRLREAISAGVEATQRANVSAPSHTEDPDRAPEVHSSTHEPRR
jgi:gas vesicle protein